MKKNIVKRIVGAVSLLLLGSCMISEDGEGTLVLSFPDGESRTVIWEPDEETMSAVTYTISLSGPSGEITRSHPAGSGNFVADSLRAGLYTVTVSALNADGDEVLYLSRNEEGRRELTVPVYRGRITDETAVLVPNIDGTGSLAFDLNLSQIDPDLLKQNPRVTITTYHAAGTALDGVELTVTRDGSLLTEGEDYTFDGASTAVIFPDSSLLADDLLFTYDNLPAGWYEVTAELETDLYSTGVEYPVSTARNWKGVNFARVMETDTPTEGSLTIYDSMLETGSLNLVIHEHLDPMAVTLSSGGTALTTELLEAAVDEPVNLEFSVKHLVEGELLPVDISALSWQWYINGDRVSAAAALSHTFAESGEYRIVLAVYRIDDLEDGAIGAASVTVEVPYPDVP
jgi:hypothetical protein